MIVYLLAVEGVKNVSKSFDDLEVGVSIADKIEREGGNSFLLSLAILRNLYQVLDPKLAGVTHFYK